MEGEVPFPTAISGLQKPGLLWLVHVWFPHANFIFHKLIVTVDSLVLGLPIVQFLIALPARASQCHMRIVAHQHL